MAAVITADADSRSLIESLMDLDFHHYDRESVLQFLAGIELDRLAAFVAKSNLDGLNFMMKLDTLKTEFASEFKILEGHVKARTESPANLPHLTVKKSFSTNTAIDNESGHFYIDRLFTLDLAKAIAATPGSYLVHGPRSSGKSTILGQLTKFLAMNRKIVYASVDTLGLASAPTIDLFIKGLIHEIARDNSRVSPVVRLAAVSFLSEPGTAVNGIQHLFETNYGGRKLVLLLDEFDSCYGQRFSEGLATCLRYVKNQLKFGGSQSYQAIVCFGAYNACRLTTSGKYPWIEDCVFANTHLDFSRREIETLFNQYCNEYDVVIDDEVIKKIHEFTGGHTGMVNACGRLLQDNRAKHVTLELWEFLEPSAVDKYTSRKVFQSIISGCHHPEYESGVKSLLARLCFGIGICRRGYDIYTEYILNLGLASLEDRGELGISDTELTPTDSGLPQNSSAVNLSSLATALLPSQWLVIKSEMIKRCAIHYILHEVDVFSCGIPMAAGLLDVVEFLTTVVRHFNQDVIRSSFAYSYKQHEITHENVPSEAVYQHQFSAVLIKALFRHNFWQCSYETNANRNELDFLIKGPNNLKVGIELTASVRASSLAEHAARPYPKTFLLDQYIVLNLTSVSTESELETFSCPGLDKLGNHVDILVYHVLHNPAFTDVVLYTGPGVSTRII
jgi:hypothetical protein